MWKDFFYFTKTERQGIIVLVVLVIGTYAIPRLLQAFSQPEKTDPAEQVKAEKEYKEFSNQFYGKKIKSKNGTTFLIYKIYKNSDGTITADLENFSKLSYGKTEPHNFENLEILKKLIAEYEKNNPTKDRPKVRKFFE